MEFIRQSQERLKSINVNAEKREQAIMSALRRRESAILGEGARRLGVTQSPSPPRGRAWRRDRLGSASEEAEDRVGRSLHQRAHSSHSHSQEVYGRPLRHEGESKTGV